MIHSQASVASGYNKGVTHPVPCSLFQTQAKSYKEIVVERVKPADTGKHSPQCKYATYKYIGSARLCVGATHLTRVESSRDDLSARASCDLRICYEAEEQRARLERKSAERFSISGGGAADSGICVFGSKAAAEFEQ